jgi:signal transduction histidine kinase
MDRPAQERAFEPFFTTKSHERRIGLGLCLVYGIVRQNQGAIHFQSEPGQGTVFRLCFPSGTEAGAEVGRLAPGSRPEEENR